MGMFEIICGVLLLVISVVLVVIVILQESNQEGVSGAVMGGSSSDNSYFSKNKGRTKEEKLKRFTKILAVAFFAIVVLVNIAAILAK